jgi:hypothetical protein
MHQRDQLTSATGIPTFKMDKIAERHETRAPPRLKSQRVLDSKLRSPSTTSTIRAVIHPQIVITGFTLMIITGLPNSLIACASELSCTMGLVSTALFGIGGGVGGCKSRWIYLVPAVALQMFTLSYLYASITYDDRYTDMYAGSVH